MKWIWIKKVLHILIWGGCLWMLNHNFSLETVEISEVNGLRREVLTRRYDMFYYFLFSIIAKAILFYANALSWFPKFLKKKNWLKYISWVSLGIVSAWMLEWGLNALHHYFFGANSMQHFQNMWSLNTVLYFLVLGLAVSYGFARNWLESEKLKQKIEEEKLKSELNFLKFQMNPHFLFNTLNNLFAQAERENNRGLALGISQLASLMRYMLYECRADLVSLSKEIEYIRSMIEIQQLRISEDDAIIKFECKGDFTGCQIAPLLLSPFVENAFKYGVSSGRNSMINIQLSVESGNFNFWVENTDFSSEKNKDEGFGIGIENSRRRLELMYAGRYDLEIRKEGESFSVRLKINNI